MPFLKAGSEYTNPETEEVHVIEADTPVEMGEFLGDGDGGTHVVKFNGGTWHVDVQSIGFTAEESMRIAADTTRLIYGGE